MAKSRRIHNINQAAFTLMEVVIAVVILASALVTLLGLQSSIITRTLRDEEKQQAMLVARGILSAIEVHLDKLEIQDRTVTAEELLKDLAGSEVIDRDKDSEEHDDRFNFMAHLKVEPWGIPNVGDNIMKKIHLSVFSESTANESSSGEYAESFETLFFVPNDDDDGEEG